MTRRPWAAAALLGVALSACPKKEVRIDGGNPPAPSAVIFVSAGLRGYLGPCGCSESMRGGIARAAYQVDQARKSGKPVLVVDAGDSLFGRIEISEQAVPQEERKARALADAFKLMGLSTRAVGELDEARGAHFRTSLGLPDQQEPVRLLEMGSHKLGVAVAPDAERLSRAAKEARARGAAFVLGLLHGELEETQRAAQAPGLEADLLVAGHSQGEFTAEESKLVRSAVPAAQVQSKGRSLMRLELTFGGPAGSRFELVRGQGDRDLELGALDGRIELLKKQVNEPSLKRELMEMRRAKLEELISRRESLASAPLEVPPGRNVFTVRFVPLESSFPSLPEARELVAAYDRDVGRLNLEWAQRHGKDCPPPKEGEAQFVGNEPCLGCHEEEFPVWEASKHARAYETLEGQGKQFHLDCVHCHVTGAERPGGVCRVDKVVGRKGVGCESCHGPGSIHCGTPEVDNVATRLEATTCVGCHDRENSPHFDFQSYREKILGPGHGKPADGGTGQAGK